jgi:hypothetical protein
MTAEKEPKAGEGKPSGSNLDGWIVTGVVFFLAAGAIIAFLQGRSRPVGFTPDKRTARAEGALMEAPAPAVTAPHVGFEKPNVGNERDVRPEPIPEPTPKTKVPEVDATNTPIQKLPPPPGLGTTAPAAPAPLKPPKITDPSYQFLSFEKLGGFLYNIPDPDAPKAPDVKGMEKKDQIPAEIHALTGKKVVVQGYMVPFKVDAEGNVRKFLLVRNQAWCCYGQVPQMNEWISVTLTNGQKTEVAQDVPIVVYGTIKVGEEYKDNFVVSIYRIEGEKVEKDNGF